MARGESVSVQFFPKTDRGRRLDQFSNEKLLLTGFKRRIVLEPVQLDLVDDRQDLEEEIIRSLPRDLVSPVPESFQDLIPVLMSSSVQLVLTIPAAEQYLTQYGRTILSHVSTLLQEYDGLISAFCLFEADITHTSMTRFLPPTTTLFQNVFEYPLYDEADTASLIKYLAAKWHTAITPADQNRIWERSGGHLWFAAEAVRQLTETGTWSDRTEGMEFRLRAIKTGLIPSELSVMEKCIAGTSDFTSEEEESIVHMRHLRAFNESGHCRIPVFTDYLRRIRGSEVDIAYDAETKRILINRVPVDTMLSRKEYRLFRLLLEKRNTIVTREEVAAALWPGEGAEAYSDWAIDQTVARLRKRFDGLTIPPDALRVVRGKGYLFSLGAQS